MSNRGKFDPIGDAFKYGPKKALSLLNSKLKNDKTISNYLANKKYDKLAAVARTLGYGKRNSDKSIAVRRKRRIKGGSNPFAQLINPRNWEIAASIGKSVIGDVIVPVVTGGFVNPLDVAKIVYDGVKKVNGKGSGRRRGGCKCGGRKIAAQRILVESPYNKGLLN